MIVSDLAKDLGNAISQFPSAANWRVGVARYTDVPGGDIDVMYSASFHTDPDDEFFLVPEGLGGSFQLTESPYTAADLLSQLQQNPEWSEHVAYVRSEVVELPDGSTASLNLPLWGTGVHEQAELVYFYFGSHTPEP